MCEFWDRLTGKEVSSAKVVGDVLILSLPDALTPQVWRLDLGKAKNLALEVWENEGGQFVLGQKSDKGDKKEITSFVTRKAAVQALMAASRAMESAMIGGAGETVVMAAPAKKGLGGKILTVLIGLILLLVLMGVLNGLARNMAEYEGGAPVGASSGAVPMSADEFLLRRQ